MLHPNKHALVACLFFCARIRCALSIFAYVPLILTLYFCIIFRFLQIVHFFIDFARKWVYIYIVGSKETHANICVHSSGEISEAPPKAAKK